MKLVLLRHGESVWNRANRFTGWVDVDLSEKGIQQAQRAGQTLVDQGYSFDVAFTSVLKRAIRTLWIVLDTMDLMWIPEHHSWRLNERHYGALQGLEQEKIASRYGEKQMHVWRRSYAVRPPVVRRGEQPQRRDVRYWDLTDTEIPVTESLGDTQRRLLPYWQNVIAPMIRSGKRGLIVAHGNSLRALMKYLATISDEDIETLYVPTGIPLILELDDTLTPSKRMYLGDSEDIQQATAVVERLL
jgi:2,3-bisphosphoglycerate-dependent phosphoglycerate mutase